MSNTPLEKNGIDLAEVLAKVNALPSGGITPSGSVTLTEENTYDVTDKATAVVDMSATRANLAEAVTAKGVDTLPTSSFDTIATNIGLIEGGGGLPPTIKELNSGIVTFDQDYKVAVTNSNCAKIPHGLSSEPTFAIVYALQATTQGRPMSATCKGGNADIYLGSYTTSNTTPQGIGAAAPGWSGVDFDNLNLKVGAYETYYIHAGVPYFWVAGIADYGVE